jgi:hypothetical protein
MEMFAEADAVVSCTDVAVTVTGPLLGIVAGAVYVVVAVLPVLVAGLKEPQALEGVHDQVTPEAVASLTTTAVSVAEAPGFSVLGGAGLNETEIAFVMVMFAEAEAVVSCTAVAVMVTEPPLGIAAGAV